MTLSDPNGPTGPLFQAESPADRASTRRILGLPGRFGASRARRYPGFSDIASSAPDSPKDKGKPWTDRLSERFGGAGLEDRDPQQVIPPEERKAAMSSLDRTEHKFALGGLSLATLAGIAVPLWVISQNRVDKARARTPSPWRQTPGC